MSVYVVLGVEFDFDIGFCVAPQKPGENCEKRDSRTIFFREISAPILFLGGRRADFFFRGVGAVVARPRRRCGAAAAPLRRRRGWTKFLLLCVSHHYGNTVN